MVKIDISFSSEMFNIYGKLCGSYNSSSKICMVFFVNSKESLQYLNSGTVHFRRLSELVSPLSTG